MIDDEFVIILAKKFGYLEKRVTYLEGKCRGQQGIIEELQNKLKKCGKLNQIQGKRIISKIFEDSVDSIEISKSIENLKGNLERFEKDDRKLTQKLNVQMGVRCEENHPLILNPNRTIDRKPEVSQSKIESPKQDCKTVKISSKPKPKPKGSHACSFCSKYFPSVSKLSGHMRVHTGERPFKCEICSKSFKHLNDLKKHSRVHTGEKPYSCSVCSKSFTQSQHRNKHIRTHTGERPYSCSVCSKTFTQSGSLIIHKRKHTGEKPYSCSLCRLKFSRSDLLKRHEKITHGQDMSTKKSQDI